MIIGIPCDMHMEQSLPSIASHTYTHFKGRTSSVPEEKVKQQNNGMR